MSLFCVTCVTRYVTLHEMTGFTKLFGSIVNSTIWREPKEVKIVWITMLALSNREGVVESSLPGLADAARVTIEECVESLRVLMSPDPYSRTKAHDGRRVQEVEGGWFILNHAKYRAKLSAEDQREKARVRQGRWRKNKKSGKTQNQVRAEMDGREARFVKAYENGDDDTCDRTAAEGLSQ